HRRAFRRRDGAPLPAAHHPRRGGALVRARRHRDRARAPAPRARGRGGGDREGTFVSRAARKLGLFTVLCFGINNIVGSGIYKLPGRLGYELGPSSWLAFAADGLLFATVALCFAAMAARHDEHGGPYVYAKEAFGPWVGFAVGWTAWVSMWAAIAGAAVSVPGYLAVFVPGADGPVASKALALGI